MTTKAHRRATHDAYRLVNGIYEDTPCWCDATGAHPVGAEEMKPEPTTERERVETTVRRALRFRASMSPDNARVAAPFVADALIAAGFGDVSAERERAERAEAGARDYEGAAHESSEWQYKAERDATALAIEREKVAALRATIDAAPHHEDCAEAHPHFYEDPRCTCWKSADPSDALAIRVRDERADERKTIENLIREWVSDDMANRIARAEREAERG